MSSVDAFKQQVMTLVALKNDGGVESLLYTFFMITIIDAVMQHMPMVREFIIKLVDALFQRIQGQVKEHIILQETPHRKTASVLFKRNYKTQVSQQQVQQNNTVIIENEVCDSIIDLVANLDQSESVEFNKFYFVNHYREIKISPDVFVQMVKISKPIDGSEINFIDFEVYSYTKMLSDIHSWVDSVVSEYRAKKQNKLGNKLYYFNERVKLLNRDINNNPIWRTAPETLNFSMTKFQTNKTLNNIYGESIDLVKRRVEFFVNNKEWYSQRGIPYTLGILMYGVAGAGKTSLIKGIASVTRRHIVNISLSDCTTKTQLTKLFFDDKIVVEKDGGMLENLIIPISKRLYVIEDIDCLSEIVLDRELQVQNKEVVADATVPETGTADPDDDYASMDTFEQSVKEQVKENLGAPPPPQKYVDGSEEKLTLSYLLNLFDGVLENQDRIVVFSSNYPQKLDRALIRPGRIDLKVEFKRASSNTIRDMIRGFYELDSNALLGIEFVSDKLTPAEVYEVLFKYQHDYKLAIEELQTTEALNVKVSGVPKSKFFF
jgi:hypothetical protein